MNWATTPDDIEIYYEDTKSSGPAIVFQSGFMGIHDIWKYQVDTLGSEYRCITHDNRGHGLSGSPQDVDMYSTEINAEDLKAVVDDAGISSPFLLVTHSMGPASGLAFAMKYPRLVQGILMAGGATLGGWPLVRAGAKEDIFSSHHTSPSASMRFYRNLGLEEDIAIEAGKWPRHVFLNQTVAFLSFTPEPDKVARLSTPTLVLHGGDDVVTPLSHPQEIVETLPNATLKIVEGANHFPQTEQPTAVNDIIVDFYRSLMD